MRTDWKKITEEAFSSDEIHVFSEDYCRRRSELQGGITMEKKRITQKTNRFNARIAATAAAFLVIPAATIGVTHFAQSSGDSSNTKDHAAAVTEAAIVPENTTLTESTMSFVVTDIQKTTIVAEIVEEETTYPVNEINTDECTLNFEKVPEVFQRNQRDCKFNYKGGAGISPTWIHGEGRTLDEILDQEFNGKLFSSESTEDYVLDKDGLEWHVYVSNRAAKSGMDKEERGWFDRDVVIKFGDIDTMMHLFVFETVTDDDLRAFIEGLEFRRGVTTEIAPIGICGN